MYTTLFDDLSPSLDGMDIFKGIIPEDMDSYSFKELEKSDNKKYRTIVDFLCTFVDSFNIPPKMWVLGEGTENGTPMKIIDTHYSPFLKNFTYEGILPLVVVTSDYEDGTVKGIGLYPNHRLVFIEILQTEDYLKERTMETH